jgi:hypothetical protein
MKKFMSLVGLGLALTIHADEVTNSATPALQTGSHTETIVCIRHGEKPPGGRGQLNCRGLNRALALPDVLLSKYGTPQFVFAPNPSQIADGNPDYYYIRPLMTIEPTAIRCGLPVNTKYGFREIKELEAELQKTNYQDATVFIAWEHILLNRFGTNMVKDNGGDVSQVPFWPGADYDTIYVFKFTRTNDQKEFSFKIDHEGLDGQSENCPQPAKK